MCEVELVPVPAVLELFKLAAKQQDWDSDSPSRTRMARRSLADTVTPPADALPRTHSHGYHGHTVFAKLRWAGAVRGVGHSGL